MSPLHRTIVSTLVMTCIALAPVLGQEAGNDETADIKVLRETLQKKAAEFPTVALNTDLKAVAFQTVDLSQTLTPVAGKKYYAFRFKTPDQPGQLIWSFVVPMHAFEWYIVPARGRMEGFAHFDKYFLPGDIKGVGKQNDCMALQRLPAETFKATSEYIIWFSFEEKVTPKMTFSLNMLSGENLEYSTVFTWFTQGNPSNQAGAAGGGSTHPFTADAIRTMPYVKLFGTRLEDLPKNAVAAGIVPADAAFLPLAPDDPAPSYLYKKNGLLFGPRFGRIQTVEVYAQGVKGFGQFKGQLPLGLTWDDTRESVLKKLGQPDDQGDVAGDDAYGMAYIIDNLTLAVMFNFGAPGHVKLVRIMERRTPPQAKTPPLAKPM